MTNKEIIQICTESYEKLGYIELDQELWQIISPDQANIISKEFSSSMLIKLPPEEISFFDWLKVHDYPVWLDLWDGADEDIYRVGVAFIPLLILKNGRGFPICDLLQNDNYFFTQHHLLTDESKMVLESSKEIILAKRKLTAAQALVLEISIAPLDIWHFAYRHQISIEKAKAAVRELIDDNAIVHQTRADELAEFIDF
ncbi:MAG: hypothetical protein NT007_18300 [Candidatus Kapabacteria bacterium]|nr:hypothetical protein [Candidatus Kapabacteria bacterium]